MEGPPRFESHHEEAQQKIPAAAGRIQSALSSVLFLDPRPGEMRGYSYQDEKVLRGDVCESSTAGRDSVRSDAVPAIQDRARGLRTMRAIYAEGDNDGIERVDLAGRLLDRDREDHRPAGAGELSLIGYRLQTGNDHSGRSMTRRHGWADHDVRRRLRERRIARLSGCHESANTGKLPGGSTAPLRRVLPRSRSTRIDSLTPSWSHRSCGATRYTLR